MAIINCDSTKAKWEVHNLCGLQKAEFNNKKKSFSIIIFIWDMKHSGMMWGLFIDGHQISIVLEDKYKTTFVTN